MLNKRGGLALLALSVFSALSLPAQISLEIPVRAFLHPIDTFHSAPGDVWFRRASVAVLETVNYGDYETTVRGVFHGPYCEQNPLFRLPGCRINKPRFTGVKVAVAAFGLAQEIPELFPAFRDSPQRLTYERVAAIANFGVAVPLGIAVAGNIRVLRSGK